MIARTPEEIAVLREGGRRLARHLQALAGMIRPGITARQLEMEARRMVEEDGDEPAFLNYKYASDKNPMPSALSVSINSAIVHNPAGQSDDVIHDGDIVSLDFGIIHGGFFTDHAITRIAGEARDPEDEKLVHAAYEALDAGIAQAKVGNTTGDIGHAVERIAKKYNLGFPRNLSGHGVGRTVHEEPHVPNYGIPGEGDKLVEGHVIAIEPMFARGSGDLRVDSGKDGHAYRTKDGSRTVHAEHTVLVTKSGAEILTEL
ncbi:MAG: methionyl aminopeptidase [Parcubacteria group bacterium Gr01-1014_8]|nr:MAG: methionyl aminopeptidase [Parcubacteria group bacterium Gr01-1014_8]